MSTISDVEPGIPHIGAAHHPARTAFWAVSGIVVAGLLGGYLAYERRQDTVAAGNLDRFEAIYARRCDESAFDPSMAGARKKILQASPTQERAVAEQLAALEAGAPCERVFQALRAVDFPIQAPSERPTITLDAPR